MSEPLKERVVVLCYFPRKRTGSESGLALADWKAHASFTQFGTESQAFLVDWMAAHGYTGPCQWQGKDDEREIAAFPPEAPK